MKKILLTASLLGFTACETVYQKLENASFRVSNEQGGGTAFFVNDSRGQVRLITAAHVCKAFGNSLVDLNIKGTKFKTLIMGISQKADLCELAVPPLVYSRFKALDLAFMDASTHDVIYVGGYPGDLNLTINSGIYSGTFEALLKDESVGTVQECLKKRGGRIYFDIFSGPFCVVSVPLRSSTVRVFPGHSGSPAVNENGKVIGVFVVTSPPSYNGMYVSLAELKEFLNEGF